MLRDNTVIGRSLDQKLVALATKLFFAGGLFLAIAAAWPIMLSTIYPDLGFFIRTDLAKFTINFAVAIALAAVLPEDTRSVRSVALYLLYSTYVLPVLVFCAMQDTPFRIEKQFSNIVTTFVSALSFAGLVVISNLKLKFSFPVSISYKQFLYLGIILSICFVVVFFYIFGLSGFNLNPDRVYEFRDLNTAGMPTAIQYAWPIIARFVLVVIFCQAIIERQYLVIGLVAVIALLFVGFTTQKMTLWFFGVAAIVTFLRVSSAPRMFSIMIGIVVVGLVAQLIDLHSSNFVSDLLVRRTLAVKAVLTDIYIDLFSDVGFNHWAWSKFSFGLTTPDNTMRAPHLVGYAIGQPGADAGTGWIGSGYAEWGLLGVGLSTTVVGLAIAACSNIDPRNRALTIGLAVMMAGVFSEADPFAALLNGGIAAALFIALALDEGIRRSVARSNYNVVLGAGPVAPRL